jgi:hypothetical protein
MYRWFWTCGRLIFFAGKHIIGHFEGFFEGAETYAQDNLGGQKDQGPLEKSQEMPHYIFCPRQKNNPLHFQNQWYIGIFMSLRARKREWERDRARARAREQEQERERESKSESKSKSEIERERERKRKREREKVRVIIFLSRPGQNEKSANYIWKSSRVCS